MTDQNTPGEERPYDWLKDTSSLTQHHLHKFSDLSKDHFLDDLIQQPLPEAPISSHQRQRAKINSQNYRQRKKGQEAQTRRELQALQRQNQYLRNQKFCRWCNRSFAPAFLTQRESVVASEANKASSLFRVSQTFQLEPEFQKPELKGNSRNRQKGKIWMALGVLMLILGVTLHGLEGNGKVVREINLQKEQVERWTQQMEQGDEYLEVKMGLKEEKPSFSKMDPGQLKILYRTEEVERGQAYEESRFSINRELLLAIQAEIDDVGFYL